MMKRLLVPLFTLSAIVATALPAYSQDTTAGVSQADLPRTSAAPFRLIPAVGASSFTTATRATLDNFDDGFTAGLFADFGNGWFNFETGVLTISTDTEIEGENRTFDVDSWGIPLLAKFNFSGMPHSTIFAKVGAMPFTVSGDADEFDVMGTAGIGGHLPLGKNSSLLVDATYNRLFTTGGDLTDYQGFTILGGLSFNL